MGPINAVGAVVCKATTNLIAYLSGLTVTQGRLAGQAFRVLPWQARFVRGAFAPGTQSAALSVGRGNGKTALLSGIAAATLDGPLAVSRGETVIVASSSRSRIRRRVFQNAASAKRVRISSGGRGRRLTLRSRTCRTWRRQSARKRTRRGATRHCSPRSKRCD